MKYCWQCVHCALTRPNQIHPEGRFYCNAYMKWIKGEDIIRCNCKGFYAKSCKTCKHQNTKLCVEGHGEYCRNYCHTDIKHPDKMFQGRTYKVTNEDAVGAEKKWEEYMKLKVGKIKIQAVNKKRLCFKIEYIEMDKTAILNLEQTLKLTGLTYRTLPRYLHNRTLLNTSQGFIRITMTNSEYKTESYVTHNGLEPRTRYRIVRAWDEVDNVKESIDRD